MRSIRPQTVTLAVLAILFGLGAAWAARQVLLTRQQTVAQPAPAPAEPREPLLVMQANLVAGARVREQDVGQVLEPVEKLKAVNILGKAFEFKQQAVGRVLKKEKLARAWLTEEDFYPVGKEPQLQLKQGYRAVNLRIDDPAVSSSMLQPGSLIDVILTTENPDNSSKLTERIVSGIEVLSPPVSEGSIPTSVTAVGKKSYVLLAATPDQASRLALAQDVDGTISVALCAPRNSDSGDQLNANRVDAILSKGDYAITVRDLLHLPPLAGPPPPPERIVVEQIRGTKIDYVVFTENDERVEEEKTRQASLPASAKAAGAKPAKKCKNCGKGAKAQGGSPTPTPGPTPTPTPAPQGSPDSPSPKPPPVLPPRTTYYPGTKDPHVGQAFQPDMPIPSGWKA